MEEAEQVRTIIVNLQLDEVISEAREALLEANQPKPHIFRHGKLLVRVWRVETEKGDYPALVPYGMNSLREELAKAAYWKRRRKDGGLTNVDPPAPVVGAILQQSDLLDVPEIDQIVSAPIFGTDGTLVTMSGYHASSRCWYEPDTAMRLDAVPMNPGVKQLRQAKQLIFNELLVDFPFETDADKAHALGLFLLPFVRPMIAGPTPMHAIDAPTVGTGKGLLSQALMYPALGKDIPATPEITDNNEMRKQITSLLLAGRSIVRFDNVRQRVDSAALAAALTEPVWEDRVLQVSENASLKIRCIWLMTGNNAEFSQEMGRRVIRIRINANTARPWKGRRFKHPELMEWIEANRGELVWAALVLVRAWIAAGKPLPECTPLGSYEEWTKVIGGIVFNAGPKGAKFLSNVDRVYDQTVSAEADRRGFIKAWYNAYGTGPVTVHELAQMLLSIEEDPFDVTGTTSKSRTTSLGMHLSQINGQVFGDFQVVRMAKRSSYRLRRC